MDSILIIDLKSHPIGWTISTSLRSGSLKPEQTTLIFERNAVRERCPVSHPLYEEFRAWTFINDLAISLPPETNYPNFLKENIFPLFFTNEDFRISVIQRTLKKAGGRMDALFPASVYAPACPMLYQLASILGQDWQTKYAPYLIENNWQFFSKESDKEKREKYARATLAIPEEDAEAFAAIQLQTGDSPYPTAVIKKMMPFLHQGISHAAAVFLANMHKVLGLKSLPVDIVTAFLEEFQQLSTGTYIETILNAIVQGLIAERQGSQSRYSASPQQVLNEDDRRDIHLRITEVLGESWNKMSLQERDELTARICNHYLAFLQNPIQAKQEESVWGISRLHEEVFQWLQNNYGVNDQAIQFLWGPGEWEKKTQSTLGALLGHLRASGRIDEHTEVRLTIFPEQDDLEADAINIVPYLQGLFRKLEVHYECRKAFFGKVFKVKPRI